MKNVEIDEKTIINYTKTIAKRYCFDGFFKTVLTQKPVLRDMILEFVLDVSNEVTQLLPNEKPKIYANEKGQIYDIFLEDKMKNQYVIEMQSRNCSKNEYTRFSNYACSLFSSQFKKSNSYNNSKSIHVIVFNNSNTSKENLLIEGYHLFEETNQTDYPVNVIGIYYINTKHLDQMLSKELSMRDLVMYQLIHLFRYDEVDHNFEVPKIIKEVAEMHEEFVKTELSDYDYLMSIKQIHDDIMYRELQKLSKEEGLKEGEQIGEERGIKKGREEGRAEALKEGEEREKRGIKKGKAEGVLEERKRNLALFIRQVLSSDDVAWLNQCSSEQLSYGLNIIMKCKSFEEFKDKVLSYSSNHLGSLNK